MTFLGTIYYNPKTEEWFAGLEIKGQPIMSVSKTDRDQCIGVKLGQEGAFARINLSREELIPVINGSLIEYRGTKYRIINLRYDCKNGYYTFFGSRGFNFASEPITISPHAFKKPEISLITSLN